MKRIPWLLVFALCFASSGGSFAQEKVKTIEEKLSETNSKLEEATATIATNKTEIKVAADTMWVMITGMLVFFMNLGFATVESGFCRAKNCVNILSKNFIVFAVTTIGFWFVGWGIMFGDGNSWFGKDGMFMVSGVDNSPTTGATGFKDKVYGDIKEKLELDLTKDEVAEANKEFKGAVDEKIAEFAGTKSNMVEKKVDGKVVEKDGKAEMTDNLFTVKVDKGGKTFEAEYKTADYYWGPYGSIAWAGVPLWAKFFFQLVFAGTAATIVSGAVAERIKYHSFIIFSVFMAILIYPVVGHWVWGGGYLQSKGFLDFAGSTQVHSIGGWAALVAVLILGPRIGKYGPNGQINAIPGHNMTAATIGCMILWFGWFGFNPGSTMAADGKLIAHAAVTTNLAACAATLTATATAWLIMGKPDIGMTLNGCLAGLVAITAGCAFVTVGSSLIIGAIAGVIVVLAVMMFDRCKIDDPVGATSVHLVNGVFGTLCIGIFGSPDLISAANASGNTGLIYGGSIKLFLVQLEGVALTAVYVAVVSAIVWTVIKLTIGIRVSAEEEIEGLDIGEHGNEAYYGFSMNREAVTGGVEPKSSKTPPGAKRYAVTVDGVTNGELLTVWSDMCQPGKATDAKLFKDVYACMTTVQGNRFQFRGGEPEVMKSNLQKLLQGKIPGKLNVSVS